MSPWWDLWEFALLWCSCDWLLFQVDEGGIKALLADSWTTFMKARMMCGAGNTQQQYNNLQQAVVLTAPDRRAGVLYGLFSNAWWVGSYKHAEHESGFLVILLEVPYLSLYCTYVCIRHPFNGFQNKKTSPAKALFSIIILQYHRITHSCQWTGGKSPKLKIWLSLCNSSFFVSAVIRMKHCNFFILCSDWRCYTLICLCRILIWQDPVST